MVAAKRTPLPAIALLWLLVQGSPCPADTGASTDLLSAPERSWLAAHPCSLDARTPGVQLLKDFDSDRPVQATDILRSRP